MRKTKKLNEKNWADIYAYLSTKARPNKGITLIALVITIIVMLILVAVTISMAINGGLFDYAGKATGETKNAINAEQELANGRVQIGGTWYDSIDDYLNKKPSTNQGSGTTGGDETGTTMLSYAETAKDENGLLKANATYTSGEYTAVIPKGFAIVPGLNGTTTIADGLVITDELDEYGNSIGNEFVWIPVEVTDIDTEASIASFYRSNWSNNARSTSLVNSTNYAEPCASGYTGEPAEYNEMLKSVHDNGGFYIGRYEAGIKTTESPRTASTTGSSNMVVQRDCYPYIYVGWGNAMNDYTSDVIYNISTYSQTDGANMGKGALALSKAMYEGEDVGATSTLCYGVMWDAMLDFIKDDTHNVTTSKTWGNYYNNLWTITRTSAKYTSSPSTDTTWSLIDDEEGDSLTKNSSTSILLTTGADDSFAAKNIFDVAGNCYEWTNEAFYSDSRVYRGRFLLQRWFLQSCVLPRQRQSILSILLQR